MDYDVAKQGWPCVARRVNGGTVVTDLEVSPCAHAQGYDEKIHVML